MKITISKENYLKTIAEAEVRGRNRHRRDARAMARDHAARGNCGTASPKAGRTDPSRQGGEDLADTSRAVISPTACCTVTT